MASRVSQHFLQYLPFAALPRGDPLPHLAVQVAEILLHLAKVGQQGPGGVDRLEKRSRSWVRVHEVHASGPDRLDFRVDGRPAALQLFDAHLGIGLAAVARSRGAGQTPA